MTDHSSLRARFRLSLVIGGLTGLAAVLPPAARAQAPTAPAGPSVVVHADQADGPMRSDCITNTTYDAIYAQTTSPSADAAFAWVRASNALSYVRCYNWLGDGMPKSEPGWFSGCRVAHAGPNGQIAYDWSALKRVLDVLVASGVRPMIVCGGIPDVMCAGPIRRNEGGQAVNRPKDYAQYQDLIAQMVRELEKTYGPAEVRQWYFEVWSQPDHEGSWEGGRPAPFTDEVSAEAVAPFNRLYDHFAAGAISADDKVRIGGPGLAGDPSFFRRFLEHCARGANDATGKPGARLDFISWNRYGTVSDILHWNAELRGMVDKDFPELKGARFILSECGSGPVEGARASTAYEAARIAALLEGNVHAAKGVDLIFRAGDLIDDHFGGYHSLITRIGQNSLPTSAFRLYMLLSKMGGERVKSEATEGVGALATRVVTKNTRNAAQVLLYRYDPSVLPGTGQPVTVKVRFRSLPTNLLRLPLRTYHIDEKTNSPYEAWVAAGKPLPVDGKSTKQDEELGHRLAGKDPFPADEDSNGVFISGGEATVDVKMAPNSVALVTLGAEPVYGASACPRGEKMRHAEDEYAAAVDLARSGGYARAVDELRKIADRYPDSYWHETALYSIVALYELDLKSPQQAEDARRELLALSLDDNVRVRLLERLRVDAVRRSDTAEQQRITAQIGEIQKRLDAQREWPLRRYVGNSGN